MIRWVRTENLVEESRSNPGEDTSPRLAWASLIAASTSSKGGEVSTALISIIRQAHDGKPRLPRLIEVTAALRISLRHRPLVRPQPQLGVESLAGHSIEISETVMGVVSVPLPASVRFGTAAASGTL